MNGRLSTSLLLACLLYAPVAHAAKKEATWERLETRDGITGYRKIVPGSSFAAWRGEGIVEGNFYRVWAVYLDSDRSCEWLAECVKNYTVEQSDLDHQITYNHTHLPWPFQDRDLVYSDTFVFDPVRREVHDFMRSVEHPKEPPRKGLVRAELLSSSFTARWIDENHTWVQVTLHLDTRGWLPAWLVNVFSRDWPYDTFVRLRRAVAEADGFDALEAKLRAAHPLPTKTNEPEGKAPPEAAAAPESSKSSEPAHAKASTP